jgi:LPXTG-site transpeptidase (sortase) family protein
MRQLRTGYRRIATWAERSLWALGLSLLCYWGWSQAAIRFEQARLEESFFSGASDHPDGDAHDRVAADLAGSTITAYPVLEPGAPVGLIEIPRVDVRAMVVEGVDSRSLDRAVGHIPGTALPGTLGNSVLAAHRDTLFAGLRHVELGDRITLRTDLRSYTYRVSAIDVVAPTAVHVMEPTAHAVLTLITCFPFDFVGPAPMRFVVSAVQEGGDQPALVTGGTPGSAVPEQAPAQGRGRASRRPLDPEVLSFVSGSLVKPGAS